MKRIMAILAVIGALAFAPDAMAFGGPPDTSCSSSAGCYSCWPTPDGFCDEVFEPWDGFCTCTWEHRIGSICDGHGICTYTWSPGFGW